MGLRRTLKRLSKNRKIRKLAVAAAVVGGAWYAAPLAKAVMGKAKTSAGNAAGRDFMSPRDAVLAEYSRPQLVQQLPPVDYRPGTTDNNLRAAVGLAAVTTAPVACGAGGGDPVTFLVATAAALMVIGCGWWYRSLRDGR